LTTRTNLHKCSATEVSSGLKAYSSASTIKQTCNLTKEVLQNINTKNRLPKRKRRKKKEKKEKKEKKKTNQPSFMNEEDRIRGKYLTFIRSKGLSVLNLIYIRLVT
jgi:hypothetical protein